MCRKRSFATHADRLRPASRRPTAPSRWNLQRDARRAAGIDDAANFFHDLASGVRDDRPGLESCLRALRKGDVLVVWKLDRLGRNLAQHRAGPVGSRGWVLRVLPGDGAQIEFEQELIRERTVVGLKAARARGRKGGRKVRAVESPGSARPRRRWRTATRRCPPCATSSASGR